MFARLTDWLGVAGHEKAMPIGVASAEIVASVLVLLPPMRVIGAGLAYTIPRRVMHVHPTVAEFIPTCWMT